MAFSIKLNQKLNKIFSMELVDIIKQNSTP